jgi:hypothetical protein
MTCRTNISGSSRSRSIADLERFHSIFHVGRSYHLDALSVNPVVIDRLEGLGILSSMLARPLSPAIIVLSGAAIETASSRAGNRCVTGSFFMDVPFR